MKKLTVKKGTQCMACLECVRACSEAFYKEFDPSKACLQIIDRNGAAKPMVCVQCGKCAEACEHGAITQNAKGVYTINKKLCVGCGKCKEACPFGVLVKVEDAPAASAPRHVRWRSSRSSRNKFHDTSNARCQGSGHFACGFQKRASNERASNKGTSNGCIPNKRVQFQFWGGQY